MTGRFFGFFIFFRRALPMLTQSRLNPNCRRCERLNRFPFRPTPPREVTWRLFDTRCVLKNDKGEEKKGGGFYFHSDIRVRRRLTTRPSSVLLNFVWVTMRIQLQVKKPEGSDIKLVDLCNSQDELKKMTVAQMKEKISKQLGIGSYVLSLSLFFKVVWTILIGLIL